MTSFTIFPNLAPYDAAKENGTVAYLPTARIRIYNRVAFQRELTATVRDHWFDGFSALAAFNERYVDSTGNLEMGGVSTAPDLTKLSHPELVEYLGVVAAMIKKTDLMVGRYRLFDQECQAVLDGVRDEDELLRAIAVGDQGFQLRGSDAHAKMMNLVSRSSVGWKTTAGHHTPPMILRSRTAPSPSAASAAR